MERTLMFRHKNVTKLFFFMYRNEGVVTDRGKINHILMSKILILTTRLSISLIHRNFYHVLPAFSMRNISILSHCFQLL